MADPCKATRLPCCFGCTDSWCKLVDGHGAKDNSDLPPAAPRRSPPAVPRQPCSPARGWVYCIIAALLVVGLSYLLGIAIGFEAQLVLMGAAPFIGGLVYLWGAGHDR